MHHSSEAGLQLEEIIMLLLCYYLLTFTFEKNGKNILCFYGLGKTKASELLSTVCNGHSPAERKAAELWLCLPFLSVKGNDLMHLLITLI